MAEFVNLLKLSVGSESVEDIAAWQTRRRRELGRAYAHVTRMWPKREAEVLNGGSIYWVVKGLVLVRQKIVALDEVIGADGIRRCGIVLDPDLVRVEPVRKRAFQGWRYLAAADAPRDLPKGHRAEPALPLELTQALADIGVR